DRSHDARGSHSLDGHARWVSLAGYRKAARAARRATGAVRRSDRLPDTTDPRIHAGVGAELGVLVRRGHAVVVRARLALAVAPSAHRAPSSLFERRRFGLRGDTFVDREPLPRPGAALPRSSRSGVWPRAP